MRLILKKFMISINSIKSDVTILSHPSDHLFDSDIVDVNNLNRVNKIYFKPHRNNLISEKI